MVCNTSPAFGNLAVLSQAETNASFWLLKPFIPHLALSMHLYKVGNYIFSPLSFKRAACDIMFQHGQ